MYFVIINKKTGIILDTADTEVEAIKKIEAHKIILEANGQRDPGWLIEAR